jgi:flagellar basal body rod protein FlgB
MAEIGFTLVEQGMRAAQQRAAVLAADAANARASGFVPSDISPELEISESGLRFASASRPVPNGIGGIEYAMAATADNSIRFRALADQERAMLREFKTVAEDAGR